MNNTSQLDSSLDQPRGRFEVLQSLLDERSSCRAFKPGSVPRSTIMQILETAQRTTSDCNIQPWKIRIVSGSGLDRLRKCMYERAISGAAPVADIPPIAEYSGVYQERRRECGWQLYSTLGIERGDRAASSKQAMENFRFFGAPHLALVTTHKSLGSRGMLDCGAYLTTFILAAKALGVGTVPQASIAYRVDVMREMLAIPEAEHVVYGVSFGWPDESHLVNSYRTSRANVEDVATFID
ncbi:nitroreductase [Paraburkholderia phymatum]|uniref:Nitroreductase n=1 Tax=Paraburkholderia phymatum (strain DSM 17167 / CIP 108236 / LMG 21445 / STM815) TaxID=391038 RepID=B2JSC5_PARP8|nr:nitroreductase [Paraburkholderia phymatum]ACC73945.1 nitroreductase [Paraburkholderia phymatum STM815]